MNNYTNMINYLSAENDGLTELQTMLVYINYTMAYDDFDLADFMKTNNFMPVVAASKLFQFGSLVKEYCDNASSDEMESFKVNPLVLYTKLCEYEKNMYVTFEGGR